MKRPITILILLLLVSIFATQAAPRRKKSTKKKVAKTTKVVPKADPRTSGLFVVRSDAPEAPDGLQGDIIALWQSHGRYWDNNEGRWAWQRSRLMGTVEDLFPQGFVIPYLIPMLEDAGAYVLTPRERDVTDVEVIADADGDHKSYSEKNGKYKWDNLKETKGYAPAKGVLKGTENPFQAGTVRGVRSVTDPDKESKAVWNAEIPHDGEYAVYVSYASLPESCTDARYTVRSQRGDEEFVVNQTMGGGTWVYLGTFPFAKGTSPVVELTNLSSTDGKTVTADAVRIGGGMGNVARGSDGEVSGYPRWCEGARYWLQNAGFPSSVYSVSGGTNDYEDDLKSRGKWVNYLAGGSRTLPGEPGLGIPVDLSFAFHTDAGTTSDPYTTIGTMPIVSTSGDPLGTGKSRTTSRRYAEIVADQVVNDIRTLHDPLWNQRNLRDKGYNEAKEPRVPAMLIELLSHQNYADMRLGLDPQFRFDVSRAIYKGILRYLHEQKGTPYVVTPLPVSEFAIHGIHGTYKLSWKPVADPLEPTARAEYYIIYERIDHGAFTEYAVTDRCEISIRPTDDRIYSYKVVAANKGGVSFPSEVLAFCDLPSGGEQVTIVNGFTRISGPAEVWRDGVAGFDYAEDYGVPYIRDIHFTGEQTEFRTCKEFVNNDAPGHGSSRATHETEVIAGNTFDFILTHGEAIRAAGHGFISSSLESFVDNIPDTPVVDLILGKQREVRVPGMGSTRFKPFTPALKSRLAEYCAAGGSLFVSGSYIGEDLFDNPLSDQDTRNDDKAFARNTLGIEWRQSKAAIKGGVKEVNCRYSQFKAGLKFHFNQTLGADCYAVESPESFAPSKSGAGTPVLRYIENDFVAGVASELNTHRVVVTGFPFETITGDNARCNLMGSIMDFLTSRSGHYTPRRVTVYPETILAPDNEDTVAATTRSDDGLDSMAREQGTVPDNDRRPRRRRMHS